nr:DUF4190 domain-containing protein [Lysinibacter cavernae]
MNVYAVLAIIFCLGWLGIVFGLIAKSKIRATGERGWALAHWGIIIGTTFTVLAVLGVAAVFVLGLLGYTILR